MATMVRDGETLGNDNQWTLKSAMGGDSQMFDTEPTKVQVIAYKTELGYSTVKVSRDAASKTITLRPIDKAGAYNYIL